MQRLLITSAIVFSIGVHSVSAHHRDPYALDARDFDQDDLDLLRREIAIELLLDDSEEYGQYYLPERLENMNLGLAHPLDREDHRLTRRAPVTCPYCKQAINPPVAGSLEWRWGVNCPHCRRSISPSLQAESSGEGSSGHNAGAQPRKRPYQLDKSNLPMGAQRCPAVPCPFRAESTNRMIQHLDNNHIGRSTKDRGFVACTICGTYIYSTNIRDHEAWCQTRPAQ